VKIDYAVPGYLILGLTCCVVAILTTFGPKLWEHSVLGPTLGPLVMILLTSLAGLAGAVIGYLMILLLGGSPSIDLISSIARLTHSKQIVQSLETRPSSSGVTGRLSGQLHWFYIPGVVFICAVGLGWDVYNADGPKAGLLQPVLHALDVFSRPGPGVGPIAFSPRLIPAFVVLTVIAGLVPAIVLPYFGNFKVTGVNWGPIHTSLVYYEVGILAGLGAILTLVGLFYRSLWLDRAPLPYHFGILALLGFSILFSLGLYLGMRQAEDKIEERISKSESGKVIVLG